MRVAIIGTACRSVEELARMSDGIYKRMVAAAQRVIEDRMQQFGLGWEDVVLTSGGAAWSDHVAVSIYLQRWPDIGGLQLHLPCNIESTTRTDGTTVRQYHDTGSGDWRTNPGRSANKYHREFSQCIGNDTLSELKVAIELGAIVDTPASWRGFLERNSALARSMNVGAKEHPLIIAFGWSGSDQPTSGGTLDTWRKTPSGVEKVYISIARL